MKLNEVLREIPGKLTSFFKVCYVHFKIPASSVDTQSPLKRDFESIRSLSNQIMHLALSGLLRIDFLNEASKILMEFTGSDCVVLWLKERGKFYRSELLRSQKDPFSFEIMTIEKDKLERIIPKLKRETWLEQKSRDVFL